MAETGETLPNFDPFEHSSSYFENFTHFASVAGPSSYHQSGAGGILDCAFDPLDDPHMWGFYDSRVNDNDNAAGNSGTGGLEIRSQWSNSEEKEDEQQDEVVEGENVMPDKARPLPPPPVPFHCSFCQVLREIIHTNGNHATKLEIHGRLGIICHAILENRQSGNEYQMFDFCKQSMESVKQFLLQYCEEHRQAGYIMLQDPLMIFYEALCPGLDRDDDLNADDFLQSSPINLDPPAPREEFRVNEQETEVQAEKISYKSSLSAQRERAASLTMREVGKYFHFPIEEAAKKLGVCPTVVKKVCRKNRVYRWPHRKLKSIEKKLTILEASLSSTDCEVRVRTQEEIERLRTKMNDIYAGVFK